VLHLAHANGFPPGSYKLLAEHLAERYHVVGLPARPLWPGSRPESVSSWQPMASDLIDMLDRRGRRDIIGVGHSLGGVLTMWAASWRPDLFRAVVLIDPVILPPLWLAMLRLLRRVGLDHRQPLVQGALHRRRTWPSRRACYEHYAGKSFFASWPPGSLRAYVKWGTRERPDGLVELAYPREWEAHIFATTPVDVWPSIPDLQIPALVMRGEHTRTFLPASQARMERLLPHARFVVVPDSGHMLPLERPADTAAEVHAFLQDADQSGRTKEEYVR
jgi:pimeloyl-ACP methyl ester carboxylesterase